MQRVMTSRMAVTLLSVLSIAHAHAATYDTEAAASLGASSTDALATTTPNLMARVNAAGVLLNGGSVSTVTKLGSGIYEVAFNQPVNNCAYVATTTNAGGQALTVFTAGGHLNPLNGVYVETKNQGGGLQDAQFDLVVNCGTKGMQYAVVGYTSNLVRASAGATLTVLGTGRYNVTFPTSVGTCAYLATVGDPSNALVYNPAGVYTNSGPNAYTVYVETKNAAGGLQAGVPFHLAVVCSSAPRSYVAVVQDTGLIKRATSLSSSFTSATGQYTVVTKAPINNCATVATRGSVSKTIAFTPATVELVPGPATNTKGFQVRDLLFFGGATANQSFHAATVCQ